VVFGPFTFVNFNSIMQQKQQHPERQKEKRAVSHFGVGVETTLGITLERKRDGKLYPRHGNIMRVIE